jgi:membrane associated rhomboid family serine protease
MLIPIGQEDATVRRHPWVSYAFILANLIVFTFSTLTGPGAAWEAEFQAKIREIVAYFDQRPYLQLPAEIAQYCGDDCRNEIAQQREAFTKARPLPPDWAVAEQQRKLDDMGAELHALRNRLPSRRAGYIPKEGKFDRALTSMFFHGGWIHLLGNMLFLFVTGPFVEDAFGRVLFPALYFVSGFAALATHAAKFPESDVPLIGASGAIAGVMGAFLVRYAARRIRMLFMPLFPFPRPRFTFGVPAFVILPLWFGEQFWYAREGGADSGVAFWAHVGGFVFGAAFAAVVRAARIEQKWIHPSIEKGLTLEQNPRLERALEARVRGDLGIARRQIAAVLAAEPANPDAWREGYEIARQAGDQGEMGRSASRLIELYARADERDLLVELLHDVSATVAAPVPARVFLVAGSYLEKKGAWDLALETYGRLLSRQPHDPGVVRALIRRGEIFRQIGEAEAARKALLQARAHPACTDGMVQAVDRALAAVGQAQAS